MNVVDRRPGPDQDVAQYLLDIRTGRLGGAVFAVLCALNEETKDQVVCFSVQSTIGEGLTKCTQNTIYKCSVCFYVG